MSTDTAAEPRRGESGEGTPATIVQNFARQVATRPGAPAMYFLAGERYTPISWSEFADGVRRLVSYLIGEGVAEQEHVAIWSANRPEWHLADVAILSARCRPVPVYLTLSADQARYVLGHSETRVVFVENEVLCGHVLQVRQELPTLKRVVVISGEVSDTHDGFVMSWQDALSRGADALAASTAEADRRAASVTLDDVATLIYTSGTTGPPKAVLLTHANVAAASGGLDEFIDAGPDDRVLSYLPLAHIAERLSTEFRSYARGHPVWFCDSIGNLGKRLREVRPTMFFGVPRVWEKMAAQVQKGVDELPQPRRALARWALRTGATAFARNGLEGGPPSGSLHKLADRMVLRKLRELLGFDEAKILASGAAPLSPDVISFFGSIGVRILEVYGQTEDTGTTTMNRPGRARLGTVGVPFRGVEIRIADDGEILVRGPIVMLGYFGNPAATAEVVRDGWFCTGDLGCRTPDGRVKITGRLKNMIATAAGKKIYPEEVEVHLANCPYILEVVVTGGRDARGEREEVHAHVFPDIKSLEALARSSGAVCDDAFVEATLRREVEARCQMLAPYKRVKRVIVRRQEFPKTTTGKIRRLDLAAETPEKRVGAVA